MGSHSDSIRVVLYYNGRKEEGRRGVIFEGEKRPTRIKRNSTIAELHEKIRAKLSLEGNRSITMITARLWQREQFISLQVVNDEDVDMVVEEFCMQSRKDFLELYIDLVGTEDVLLPVRSGSARPAEEEEEEVEK